MLQQEGADVHVPLLSSLMQTGHAIGVHQLGVAAVRKQEPGDVRVATVAGPVQGGGPTTGLGITLGSAFQQELAHSIVPIAAGIVQSSVASRVRLTGVCRLLD